MSKEKKITLRLKTRTCISFILVSISFGLFSCKEQPLQNEDVLIKIGNKELTFSDVINQIPYGLLPSDSIAIFQNIIEDWLKDELLADFAENHLLDLSLIDRQVKDYRDKLIVEEYLKRMSGSHKPAIDEKTVKDYYESHQKDLKTEIPLVKGIFLKVNIDTKGKEQIRELLKENSDENIDKLEKEWMDKAVAYDYFKDRWVDWETVNGLIPYRFGDPDNFLQANKYFETDNGDFSYFLQISDFLPSGSVQPYDFASVWISSMLGLIEINQYEVNLVNTLLKKSIEDNKLEIIGYDPIEKKMIKNHNKN